jgi:PASTA domain
MRARTSVVVMAVGCALALAPAAGADTVTLGSTVASGSLTNLCSGGTECTYLPFNNVYSPGLVVPFDGTITSFSVNSGSGAGAVKLRVMRPASGGRFTGAGTSAAAPLSIGVQTYSTSLPVRTGDLLGIENDSSALIFDTGTLTTFTAYYALPALGDGASAAPNNIAKDRRLLLSAVLTYTPPTGGGTSPSGGGNVPGTPIVAQCIVPKLRNLTLAKARKALTTANCKLGKVTRVRDKRFKRGRVISQTPDPKWRRDVGAKVSVKLSLGPPKKRR